MALTDEVMLINSQKNFAKLVLGTQVVLVILFGCYAEAAPKAEPASVELYNYFTGVLIMMFVGFGYLMACLRWYGLGAVGFTMLVTALGMEVSLLVEPLIAGAPITVSIKSLLTALFAVAAFLISFGGNIGKVGPSQLVVLVILESIFYCANKQLLLVQWLGVSDVGGTIVIHMFGAYFGLAVAWVLGEPTSDRMEKTSTVSDIFSLIGTSFLWLYWPSFVAAEIEPGTAEAELALVQTVLALIGSTVVTFGLSPLLSGGKIRPVDIQNASLAGGVAIGVVANFPLGPAGAMSVGCAAGAVSTLGFCRIQGFLSKTIQLHDTCGIHNLHGMPSIVGGLASVVCGYTMSSGPVPSIQLAGIAVTLAVASVSGIFTGNVLKHLVDGAQMADDSAYWVVSDDFGKEQ